MFKGHGARAYVSAAARHPPPMSDACSWHSFWPAWSSLQHTYCLSSSVHASTRPPVWTIATFEPRTAHGHSTEATNVLVPPAQQLQMRLSNWSLTLGASMAWALGALYFDGMTSGLCSKPSTLRTSRVVRRGGGDPGVLNVFFALVLPVSVAQSASPGVPVCLDRS